MRGGGYSGQKEAQAKTWRCLVAPKSISVTQATWGWQEEVGRDLTKHRRNLVKAVIRVRASVPLALTIKETAVKS